jgi:hypothetical protein
MDRRAITADLLGALAREIGQSVRLERARRGRHVNFFYGSCVNVSCEGAS